MIRSALLAAISAVALGSVAMAADLPSEKGPPVYAPPPPPAFSWTGFYIGGQVGYEWGSSPSAAYTAATGALFEANPTIHPSGVVGGGHIGYNYQLSQFVFGVEGDVNGSDYAGSGNDLSGLYLDHSRTGIDASFRARVGVAFDRVLVYATGGGAYGSIISGTTYLATGASETNTVGRIGWTAGGGIEYAIDNNWSVRAEYRYTDYGYYTTYFGDPAVTSTLFNVHLHETDNRVQVGFSYLFNAPPPPAPPVVAKY
jgi:outer membrane immunogenic protein